MPTESGTFESVECLDNDHEVAFSVSKCWSCYGMRMVLHIPICRELLAACSYSFPVTGPIIGHRIYSARTLDLLLRFVELGLCGLRVHYCHGTNSGALFSAQDVHSGQDLL